MTKPIIFILSSSGSIKLCSRLLERYHQINYLSINDIANIEENEQIGKMNSLSTIEIYRFLDLEQHEYRYDSIRHVIEQRRSQVNGFIIAGELSEEKFLKQWQKKVKSNYSLIFFQVDKPFHSSVE